MQKNNPINSVYLIALAVASLILYVNSLFEAAIFAVCIVATFLIGISVVSMIEKVADKHVRFLIYSLICAAVLTILKVSAHYISIVEIVTMAQVIDIAILPCLLLAIVPIYFEEDFSAKQYFGNAFLTCIGLILMLGVYGAITEIAGFGTIWGYGLGFNGIEFFAMPYGNFFVIGCIAILFNMVRRAHIKRTRSYRNLVEQYKVQIREIQDSAVRERAMNKEEGGDK